jgi:hypothetical protein
LPGTVNEHVGFATQPGTSWELWLLVSVVLVVVLVPSEVVVVVWLEELPSWPPAVWPDPRSTMRHRCSARLRTAAAA